MDDSMKQIQEKLIEVEIEGESLLLARQQVLDVPSLLKPPF